MIVHMRLNKNILRLLSMLLPIYLLSVLMLTFINLLIFALYKTLFWSWPVMLILAFGVMVIMLGLFYLIDCVDSVETVDETKEKPDDNDNLIGFLAAGCVLILMVMPLAILCFKMK